VASLLCVSRITYGERLRWKDSADMRRKQKQELLVTGGLITLLGVMGMQQYVLTWSPHLPSSASSSVHLELSPSFHIF
jgi:hypothetical protein